MSAKNSSNTSRFTLKPVYAAVALAMGAQFGVSAWAVNVNQIPANGYVVAGAATATAPAAGLVNGVAVGNMTTITLTANSVIQWASTATARIQGATVLANTGVPTSTPSGFDVGPNAGVAFGGAFTALNVDVTGNPSIIAGQISSVGNLYVANANGITVASGAQIVAPVMGLINADLSSTQATTLFGAGALPLNFAGTAGVTVQAGANLSQATTVLIAGSGNLNVVGEAGVVNYIPNTKLLVDAGVGGYVATATGTPTLTLADNSAATPVASLTAGNYTGSFYTSVSGSSLNLNLGTTNSPFNFLAGSQVVVDGNATLAGSMASAASAVFSVNGTLTNTGLLNANNQTGATVATGAAALTLYPAVTANLIYNNATAGASVPLGGFVNTSAGTIVSNALTYNGSSFDNEGALVLGNNNAQPININAAATATTGPIFASPATGTITLAGTITTPQTGAAIGVVMLSGGTVNVNTTMANVGGAYTVTAGTLNINSTVSQQAGNSFLFDANTNGALNVATAGSVTADNVSVATQRAFGTTTVRTDVVDNGSIVAQANGGSVKFGRFGTGYTTTAQGLGNVIGGAASTTATVANGGVSGSGSVTADNVQFNALMGAVNNNATTNMFQNGFVINNGPSGSTSVTFNAINGSQIIEQGVNLKINGNASINSGKTQVINQAGGVVAGGFPTPYGSAGNFTPNNASSRLVVQASGVLSVLGGSYSYQNAAGNTVNTSDFEFPGLVYLAGGTNLNVGTVIDNAYAVNSPAGYGVWLVSPNTVDQNGVITLGNRVVNFVSQNANANSAVLGGWGSKAQLVNGTDVSTASASTISALVSSLTAQNMLRLAVNPSYNAAQPVSATNSPVGLFTGYLSFDGNTLAQ